MFVARNEEKGNFLKQQLKNDSGRDATMIIANLSSQAEVKRAANEFLALEKPLDILLNNAGIMNRERNETVDGLEEVFSVNHLAYFTLSLMLSEKLRQTENSRIINVASGAHQFVKDMNFDDLQSEKTFRNSKRPFETPNQPFQNSSKSSNDRLNLEHKTAVPDFETRASDSKTIVLLAVKKGRFELPNGH